MIEVENLYVEISDRFSIFPLPHRSIRKSDHFRSEFDIEKSLNKYIVGRRWDSLTLHDWAMVGVTPGLSRYYLTAHAFYYYFPSILTGVCKSGGPYVEFAIDALSVPKDGDRLVNAELQEWWIAFRSLFSACQVSAVLSFVAYVEGRSDIYPFELAALQQGWV